MRTIHKVIATGAVAAASLTGGVLGASMLGSANAQTTSTTNPAASSASGGYAGMPGNFDPTQGGHVGANGVREVLLTGDTATKVRAAAQAAVPGGTIQRVETDAEGSPYEAHMTKSDGTPVTVKVDSTFKVTNVETDPGPMGGPHGGGQPAPSSSASGQA